MLLPTLTITQPAENASVLRLEDTTPGYDELRFPGGFGGINPTRQNIRDGVARVTLSIRSSLNPRTISPYLPETNLPIDLFIRAGQFDLHRTLPDGLYWQTIRAYSTTGVPVLLCDYLMGPVSWQTGYRLDVMAGSVWVDVTADAIVEKATGNADAGTIHWQTLQTATSYSLWRLSSLSGNGGSTVVDQGTLLPINPQPSTTQTGASASEVLISNQDYPLLLCGELERKIARLATSLSREQSGSIASHVLARQGAFATLFFGYEQLKKLSPAASPYALDSQLGGLHRQADRLLSAQPQPIR